MPRIGVGYYPYTFRDGDHLIKWAQSPAFKEMVGEWEATVKFGPMESKAKAVYKLDFGGFFLGETA